MPIQCNTIDCHLVSAETVAHIATLARISLTPAECECFTKNLGDILGHMEALNVVNTDHIEPMYHAMDLHQRLDLDIIREHNQRELLQSVAPRDPEGRSSIVAGLYLVPKVID